MEKIIVAVVLFLIAAGLFILSFRYFREKGFLFNNAYIYASKQERERMNKKTSLSTIGYCVFAVGSRLCIKRNSTSVGD